MQRNVDVSINICLANKLVQPIYRLSSSHSTKQSIPYTYRKFDFSLRVGIVSAQFWFADIETDITDVATGSAEGMAGLELLKFYDI